MNILFWNMNGKTLDECLKEIAVENNCDFIILAEYPGDIHFICKYLNMYIQEEYCVVPNNGGCNRIKAMIKSSYKTESISEQGRYQIIRIQTVYYQLIVAMMHNISKHQSTDREQEEKLREMNNDILQNENIHKTRNVLIVGDLNMNPFEEACVAANTIHGIRTLLKKDGKPDNKHYSDHLPIFVRIEEGQIK